MKLYLLTVVTRPGNLPAIWDSISEAHDPYVDLVWLVTRGVPDDPGGQMAKNVLLDSFDDGWFYILDDDNLLHPEMPARVAQEIARHPRHKTDAVVFWQEWPNNQTMKPVYAIGEIDAGCVVMRRSYLGKQRIPPTYEGDGILFCDLLPKGNTLRINEPLAYYNRLRW